MCVENLPIQTKTFFGKIQQHNVLVIFVVGLLDENGIIVDMLEVHDQLVKDLNLA